MNQISDFIFDLSTYLNFDYCSIFEVFGENLNFLFKLVKVFKIIYFYISNHLQVVHKLIYTFNNF